MSYFLIFIMNEFIVFEKITNTHRIQCLFIDTARFSCKTEFFFSDEILLESKLKSIMLGQITICRSFFLITL